MSSIVVRISENASIEDISSEFRAEVQDLAKIFPTLTEIGNSDNLVSQPSAAVDEAKRQLPQEIIEKRLPGGLIYLGQVLNGKLHGQGKLKWPDGGFYEGDFKENLRSGKGTHTYPGNEFYYGDWVNGKFNGEGCYRWQNGDFYEGTWVDGVKSGYGKYIYSNHTSYKGDWLNDKPHGIVKSVDARGVEIRGEWRAGELIHRFS